jgi:hypothetical protein
MKRHFKLGALAGAGLMVVLAWFVVSRGLADPASAQDPPCSQRTLKGYYGFTIIGQTPVGPVTGVALTKFDGDGKLTQVDNAVHNGMSPGAGVWRPSPGSYDLNSDCTGTMEIDPQDGSPSLYLSIVVDQGGREIRTVVDNPGTQTTSIGVRRDSPSLSEDGAENSHAR